MGRIFLLKILFSDMPLDFWCYIKILLLKLTSTNNSKNFLILSEFLAPLVYGVFTVHENGFADDFRSILT